MMISSLYKRSILPHNQIQTTFTTLTTYISRTNISFVSTPHIISPYTSSSNNSRSSTCSTSSSSLRISSLDIDNTNESRFLLCGSYDGTVSVYDLSLLGSDYYINQHCYNSKTTRTGTSTSIGSGNNNHNNYNIINQQIQEQTTQQEIDEEKRWKLQNTFHPICHSQKITQQHTLQNNRNSNDGVHDVPNGHCSPITKVLWYTIDSGIFLSSDCNGNILIWDSNMFMPVSCLSFSKSCNVGRISMGMGNGSSRRYGSSSFGSYNTTISSICSINNFDLPKCSTHHMQLAVGCTQNNNNDSSSFSLFDDRSVYLCDVKSGSTTQQLIGHGKSQKGGISTVQWSPINEFILVSSGYDGCIKLWDVRKSGSSACLLTLDQEMKLGSAKVQEYELEQGHRCHEKKMKKRTSTSMMANEGKRRKLKDTMESLAPSNYSKVECSAQIQSHDGPVTSLSFTPDGEYIVSCSPADGINVWHLERGYSFAMKMPQSYLGPNSLKHPLRKKQRKVPIVITQPGPNRSGTVWLGTNNDILGYDIHGIGGVPNKVLYGHIDNVTAVTSHDSSMRLFSGGADGMILAWGCDIQD